MAIKKSARKKAKTSKTKNGSTRKRVMALLVTPVLITLVSIGLAGYFVVNLQIAPVNARHQQALVESIASQYESYVNNVLKQQSAMIAQVAASPAIIEQVSENNRRKLTETEILVAEQIPDALSVHIFPVRSAQLRLDSIPPLSHAGLDMIRRAEQGQDLSVEAHQYDGKAYLNSVKAIRNDDGRQIGTVTVTQSLNYLTEELGGIDASKGNLLIQQHFAGAPAQTLVTYGAKNRNPVITMNSDNPNWTLTFQPADELALSKVVSTNSLWIVFIILAVTTVLPMLLASQRLQAAMRKDANAFAKEIQAILSGQKTTSQNFNFAIFNTLTKTIHRMRMGKPGAATVQKPATDTILDSGLAHAAIAEETTELDVAMMEDDNNLLGMSELTERPATPYIDKSIFRTYDIRGIYGQTLTNDVSTQIGLAVGSEVSERGEQSVIVGRDGRLSSPEVAQALIRGLTASGRNVIDIGVVPTPVCYFACEYLSVSSCVMVTGSNNPSDQNGFKIVIGGDTLLDDEIIGLYHRIENKNFLSGQGTVDNQEVSNAYLSRISQDVQATRPLKVVVDCGNGVAGHLAPQLIKGIGCHVLPLFCDVDGNFPNHRPDPSDANNLKDLVRTVTETRADIGLAFDADGDRLGLVTNSGKVIYADRMLMLLAKQVLQSSPGATVVYDVKSSRRLKNLIIGFGGKAIMWKTGHSFIKRKMKETGAILAGEMSGHVFYKDRWYGFDDALYTAARLLEIIAGQNETVDTLFNELPQDVSTPELSIFMSDDRKFNVIESLQRNAQAQFGGGQVSDIDGLRVDFQDGWGLVRASNTTPKLICRFEADNELALQKIQTLFKEQLLTVDSELQIPF